jgi:cytoskeletal protein CcmA (bactofilin family)
MLKHTLKGLIILSVVLLLVLITASSAWAADLRQGDTVVIASGDVINDDLYVAASLLVINGTVNGDILWVGQTLNMNGTVNGNITALGMNINIDGDVSKSVRVAGSSVNIRGRIGGDLMVAGSTVEMTNKGTIGRDLAFAASKINIDSMIKNSVRGYGNEATLSNTVGSDVEINVNSLTIASSAQIRGDLIYTSKDAANIQNGALIAGTTTHKVAQTHITPSWPPLGVWGSVIAFFMTLLTGIVIIVVAPKRAKLVAAAIKSKPLPTLGWGALIFFVTPIAAVIVCITVIGIPVGLIGLALYGIGLYVSLVVVSLFIGSWILGRSSKVETRGLMIGAFALGLIILTLVNLIPYLGVPLFLATAIFGIGAMFVAEKTLRSARSAKVAVVSSGQPSSGT